MFSPMVSSPFTQHLVERAVGVVLRAERFRPGLETGAVLVGPPVALDACGIRLAALVVEAVAHLVADHRADRAVVHRRIRVDVEERRLQDRGREHDLVEARVVVGVDRLRGHEPFVAVGLLADAGVLVVEVVLAHGKHVGHQVVRHDGDAAVVTPLARVADLGTERIELLVGLGLGRIAHPVDGFRGSVAAPRAGWRPAGPSPPWLRA